MTQEIQTPAAAAVSLWHILAVLLDPLDCTLAAALGTFSTFSGLSFFAAFSKIVFFGDRLFRSLSF